MFNRIVRLDCYSGKVLPETQYGNIKSLSYTLRRKRDTFLDTKVVIIYYYQIVGYILCHNIMFVVHKI